MREIKFRAWDKERKDMRQIQLMDWSDWWVSTGHTWEREKGLEYGERNSFKNEETDRHILMQYTGLKDKNGREIYEGDIVHRKYHESNTVAVRKVVFHNDGFKLQETGEYTGLSLLYPAIEDIEVIGNIYENPELLEV